MYATDADASGGLEFGRSRRPSKDGVWRMTEVDVSALLEEYQATPTAWDLSQRDAKETNRLYDRLRVLAGELRSSDAGRHGITALIRNPNVGVRLVAAYDSLAWAPDEAVRALEEIERGRGLHAVTAKYTLKAFHVGRPNSNG